MMDGLFPDFMCPIRATSISPQVKRERGSRESRKLFKYL